MRSMTAIAQGRGDYLQADGGPAVSWEWEMRAVNSRGLDLRLRVPEGLISLEKTLRDRVAATISRGAVTVSLRLSFVPQPGASVIDEAALSACLDALARITELAAARGVSLRDFSALELLSRREIAVSGHDRATIAPETLVPVLAQDLDRIVADLDEMRAAEGAELNRILAAHIDRVTELVSEARTCLEARTDAVAASLDRALARVAEPGSMDAGRVAQELALIAVKADVSEELDRLEAHCVAARVLLDAAGPVGRKLDFLTQEFNREANTLCSKAQHEALSRIGLDLKSVIDQMREQVQNVE